MEPGKLEVVATPIGNLQDLSPRARERLSAADLVVAEDTRRTGQLLSLLGISRPLLSLHEHNEVSRIEGVLARLRAGETVALVSDAGTPLISDPGQQLVRAAAAAGIVILTIPGPCSVTAALSIAGLPTDRFAFEGFLPARAGERRAGLQRLLSEPRTMVFFEAPHRLAETMDELARSFGERDAVIARELTKVYETVYRGRLPQLAALVTQDANVARGEIVILVAGTAAEHDTADMQLLSRALPLLLKELPPARAASIAAKLCSVERDVAYAMALQIAAHD